MIGGFLGAGKTTTLSKLASFYKSKGFQIGMVTNDQANDLVDTQFLRSSGFSVEEVPGACFCCRFDELIDRVHQFKASQQPMVILAEPVGSCTDLVATVVQPIRDLYREKFSVAPYPVLFKPSHGLKILRKQSSGFSAKAAYIFRKQLEEADTIVINRIDEVEQTTLEELHALLEREFPKIPILELSAKLGNGIPRLAEFLDQEGVFGQKILDIDYDIYAEGEAELGWLNTAVSIKSNSPFSLDQIVLQTVEGLRQVLLNSGGEVAHLKVIGMHQSSYAVANWISNDLPAELSWASHDNVDEAELIVNARMAIDPVVLEQEVQSCLRRLSLIYRLTPIFRQSQSLRPGRPTPTHRYAQPKLI